MMSQARFNRIDSGLTSTARKVYNAVPLQESWSAQQIVAELKRGGVTHNFAIIVGCLNSLIQAGIVRETDKGMFCREPIKAGTNTTRAPAPQPDRVLGGALERAIEEAIDRPPPRAPERVIPKPMLPKPILVAPVTPFARTPEEAVMVPLVSIPATIHAVPMQPPAATAHAVPMTKPPIHIPVQPSPKVATMTPPAAKPYTATSSTLDKLAALATRLAAMAAQLRETSDELTDLAIDIEHERETKDADLVKLKQLQTLLKSLGTPD
jgi:hypothetical protein